MLKDAGCAMSSSAIPSAAPTMARATRWCAPKMRGGAARRARRRSSASARPLAAARCRRRRSPSSTRQLAGSLPDGLAAGELAIAYEPVWAIGTGRTPTIAEVEEVHAHIRRALAARCATPARIVRILYGGSVKPDNAAALLHAANVDGALVGGASLMAADFWAIARACGAGIRGRRRG